MANEASPKSRQTRKATRSKVAAKAPKAKAKRATAKRAPARKAAPAAAKRTPARKAAPAAAKRKAVRPPTLRGPAPTSARAGAPEIMVTLNSEHRYISSLLEALAEQADNLLPGRTPDYALMQDIVHYMASFPDEYHHPREDLVFERLVMRDPQAKPAVEELLEGHRDINRRSRELLAHLEHITRGERTPDNQKLKYLCDSYIGHYWDHINTEEGKVFPRATAKLRQEDWFDVNSKAKYVDDPLFGTRVRKEYQRLSQYLTDRVGRVTEDIAVAELFGIEALIETVAALGNAGGELQEIVRKRVSQAVRDSKKGAGTSSGVIGMTRSLGAAAREHARAGAKEVRAVIKRTRNEISEPFATRMKFLRRLVREDAG
jgi:hemerythrin-like domain-containing protein